MAIRKMFGEVVSATKLGFGKHPIAFAASAIAAPFLVKNDERGYGQSALITTPLVGAFFAAGPRSFGMAAYSGATWLENATAFAQRNTKGVLLNASSWYLDAGPKGLFRAYKDADYRYDTLRSFVNTGELGNLFSSFKTETFGNIARNSAPRAHQVDADYVFNTLEHLVKDPSKTSLVTHAFEEARVNTLGMGARGPETALKDFSQAQMSKMFFDNYDNQEFMSRLSRNLRKAERLVDRGIVNPQVSPPSLPNILPLNSEVEAALESQGRGSVLKELRRSGVLENNRITAQAVLNGETGRVLGIQLTTGGNRLQIPILDPSTGTVHLGDSFERVGVARSVYDAENIWDLDMYLARNAGQDWNTLNTDLGRAAYHTGIDPLNTYKMRVAADSRSTVLAPHQIKMRSFGAVPSGLNSFSGGKSFADLSYQERVNLFGTVTDSSKGLRINGDSGSRTNLTAIGSASAFSSGVLDREEAALLAPGGVNLVDKPDPFFRDFTKEVSLEGVATDHVPWYSNNAAKEMLGVEKLPEVQLRVAGISPQVKSILGGLKDVKSTEDRAHIVAMLKERMAAEGMTAEQQGKAVSGLVAELERNPRAISTARKVGSLGETDFFMSPDYQNLRLKSRAIYHVDSSRLNVGDEFDPDTVLGYSDLRPVTSPGARNRVADIQEHNGRLSVTVDQLYPVETGSKISAGGVKGLTLMAEDKEEFLQAKRLVNIFREAQGETPLADSIGTLAPSQYFNAKVTDPYGLLLEQAGEVAQATMDNPATEEFFQGLERFGMHVEANGRIIDQIDELRKLTAVQRRARLLEVAQFTEDYINAMGSKASALEILQSDLLKGFVGSNKRTLSDYMRSDYLVVGARFTDTTRRNLPRTVPITADLASEMYRMGHYEGLKEIYGRAETINGDPKRAFELLDYIRGENGNKPLGNIISAAEAESSSLYNQTGVFSADRVENFSLALDKEFPVSIGGKIVQRKYVPMLGREAYKGGLNEYGLDEVSGTVIDRAKQRLVQARGSDELTTKALQEYYDTVTSEMLGKSGVFRARRVDPEGMAAFLQNRPQANPFDVVISQDRLEHLKAVNPLAYRKLKRGGSAWATITRQPVSAALKVRVRYDPEAALGRNMLGFDEAIRGMLGADDDLDAIYMTFHKNAKAVAEAKAAYAEGSSQWSALNRNRFLFGSVEDSRNISAAAVEEKLKSKSFAKLAAAMANTNPAEAMTNRLVGTKIPQYSNLLTNLNLVLENHPTLKNNEAASQTLREMFWQIRQVPISGSKSQMGFQGDPMRLHDMIKRSLQGRADPGLLIDAMKQVAEQADRSSIITKDTLPFAKEFGLDAKVGDSINVFRSILDSEKVQGWLREFAGNSQEIIDSRSQANALSDLITRRSISAEDGLKLLNRAGTASPEIQGVVRGNMGATRSAEALGSIVSSIKAKAGKAAEAFGAAKPILAAGLAVAAVAGIMTSTVSNDRGIAPPAPRHRSANNYRPEEMTSGTDHIPGEPVAGSRAASNPKRTRVDAPPGTQRAVVAPVRQATNLQVTMPARDRDQTAEAERVTQRVAAGSGYASITKNYSGSWMQTASRLRTRQKISDMLDQD
jgi:hypothetical protein